MDWTGLVWTGLESSRKAGRGFSVLPIVVVFVVCFFFLFRFFRIIDSSISQFFDGILWLTIQTCVSHESSFLGITSPTERCGIGLEWE